jgi:hypothetical protein
MMSLTAIPASAIGVEVELHVDIPEPPKFLDILLSDPADIVDALELVLLKTAESASSWTQGYSYYFSNSIC